MNAYRISNIAQVVMRPVLVGLLAACAQGNDSSDAQEVGMQQSPREVRTVSGGQLVAMEEADSRTTVRLLGTEGAQRWSVTVAGRLAQPLLLSQPIDGSLVVASSGEETVRLVEVGLSGGERVWGAELEGHLAPGPTGVPDTLAVGDAAVVLASDNQVAGVDRRSGESWVVDGLPIAGAARRAAAGAEYVAALDTERVRTFSPSGQPGLNAAVYSNGAFPMRDGLLYLTPERTHYLWSPSGPSMDVVLQGRLRPSGWRLPDGGAVVGLHGLDGGIGVARIGADGVVAWVSPVQGLGFLGESVGDTGSGRVPFVVETDGATQRVVMVNTSTGVVEEGRSVRMPALMDAEFVGGTTHAALVLSAGALVVSVDGMSAGSQSFIGLDLDGAEACGWHDVDGEVVRAPLQADVSLFGW